MGDGTTTRRGSTATLDARTRKPADLQTERLLLNDDSEGEGRRRRAANAGACKEGKEGEDGGRRKERFRDERRVDRGTAYEPHIRGDADGTDTGEEEGRTTPFERMDSSRDW